MDEKELSSRLKDYNLPEPRYTSSVLYKYSKLAKMIQTKGVSWNKNDFVRIIMDIFKILQQRSVERQEFN